MMQNAIKKKKKECLFGHIFPGFPWILFAKPLNSFENSIMRSPFLLIFLIRHLWLVVVCLSLRSGPPARLTSTQRQRCSSNDEQHLTTPNSLRQHSQQSTTTLIAKLITSTAVATTTANVRTVLATTGLSPPSSSELSESDDKQLPQEDLILPLTEFDGVWTVNYTIGAVMFRAIVDTGSPFLIVPSVCSRSWGGCSQTGRFPLAR